MLATQAPFAQYFDSDGSPLDGGKIYFGVANADPESSPVTVYWDADGTIPAAQPIPTLNGYAVRSGSPATVYASGNYSVRVRNARNEQVVYAPTAEAWNTALSVDSLRSDLAGSTASKGAALVGHLPPGTGTVARTVGDELDALPVRLSSYLTPAQLAQARTGVLSFDASAAVQRALDDGRGREVVHDCGALLCLSGLSVHPGTDFHGEGFGAWRAAPFSNINVGLFDLTIGSTLVFGGTGERTQTVDFVTESRQCGYDRTNPSSVHGTWDAEFLLADFTNRNASGATPATLRQFSAAIVMGSGADAELHPTRIHGMRIVTSCPDGEGTYGIRGYGNQSTILPWADWDIGVWAKSPWRCEIDCQVVGYWNIRGVLATSMNEASGATGSGGFGEFFRIDGMVQGGLSIRSGDIWPIAAKTADTLSVQWTASHRFQASGTLTTSAGNITYTGLTFDGGTSRLIFTGCSDTTAVVVGGDTATVIRMTPNGGWANTVIGAVEINDFAHATRVEEQSASFGVRRMPVRPALEISGHPTRGIELAGSLIFGTGPVAMHFGNARDVEMRSIYCEPKAFKTALGGAEQSAGALFICGPKSSYSSVVPLYDKGAITSNGTDLASFVNLHPLAIPPGGRRLSAMTDVFNPKAFYSDKRNRPATGQDLIFQGNCGKSIQFVTQSAGGADRLALDMDSAGNVTVGPAFASNVTKLTGGITRITNDGNRLQFEQTDGPADSKVWEILNSNSSGTLIHRTATDAYAAGTTYYTVTRSGANVTGQTFTVNSGNFTFGGGSILPAIAATTALGSATLTFTTAWLSTGAINSSDARLKTPVRGMSDSEVAASKALAREIGFYRFLDAVAAKGEGARWHAGTTVQRAIEIMRSHGLDPFAYGFICHDAWDDQPAVTDDDGTVIRPSVPAGDRYSFRNDGLLLFIARGLDARLAALEMA